MPYILMLLYFLTPYNGTSGMSIIQCDIESSIQFNKSWSEILKSIDSCAEYNYKRTNKGKWFSIRKRLKAKKRSNRWKKYHKNNVQLTMDFLENRAPEHIVDSFFMKICTLPFRSFPFEQSGRLRDVHYVKRERNESRSDSILISMRGMIMSDLTVDELYASVITSDYNSTIEQLISYLDNDAATRLVVIGVDVCDPSYYFKISDVALELIEMMTYCDFYDKQCYGCKESKQGHNANGIIYSSKLEERKDLKNRLTNWHSINKDRSMVDRVIRFLDTAVGESFIKTCKNLEFLGYSGLAHSKLEEYYSKLYPNNSSENIKKLVDRVMSK